MTALRNRVRSVVKALIPFSKGFKMAANDLTTVSYSIAQASATAVPESH